MIVAAVVLGVAGILALMLLRGASGRAPCVAVTAALGLGLAGYALTGRPGLPGAPALQPAANLAATSAFETERQRRLPRFGETAAWLTFADALIRADASDTAVSGLRQAADRYPDSYVLWIGLGNALAVHAGRLGTASRLAFDRAATLNPQSAEPEFFRGLAELETGDARGAARTWRTLAARSLPDPDLDRWIAVAEQQAVGQE